MLNMYSFDDSTDNATTKISQTVMLPKRSGFLHLPANTAVVGLVSKWSGACATLKFVSDINPWQCEIVVLPEGQEAPKGFSHMGTHVPQNGQLPEEYFWRKVD